MVAYAQEGDDAFDAGLKPFFAQPVTRIGV